MATPPQILDDAATSPGGALPAMATPPQILDATPPTDDEPDADALLAWPEICDLMNLQAPDAWRPRHAAVRGEQRPRRLDALSWKNICTRVTRESESESAVRNVTQKIIRLSATLLLMVVT